MFARHATRVGQWMTQGRWRPVITKGTRFMPTKGAAFAGGAGVITAGLFALPKEQRQIHYQIETNRKIMYGILAINTTVFGLFSMARGGAGRLSELLIRHGMGTIQNLKAGRLHTLLTCTFSHASLFHFAMNSYAGYLLMSNSLQLLRPGEFIGLYCGAGIVSSLAEILFMHWLRMPCAVVGASGSLMAFFSLVALSYPQSQWGLIFLPYYTSAANMLKAVMAFDIGGTALVFLKRAGFIRFSSTIAHRGHLAGLATGYVGYRYLAHQRSLRKPPSHTFPLIDNKMR